MCSERENLTLTELAMFSFCLFFLFFLMHRFVNTVFSAEHDGIT